MQDDETMLASILLGLLQLAAAPDGPAAEPLPPDEDFKPKVSVRGPNTLIAELAPAPERYQYKSKVSFALKNANGAVIRHLQPPAGEVKNDPFFGTMEVYHRVAVLVAACLRYRTKTGVPNTTIKLHLSSTATMTFG